MVDKFRVVADVRIEFLSSGEDEYDVQEELFARLDDAELNYEVIDIDSGSA